MSLSVLSVNKFLVSFRIFVEADQPQPYGADYAYCSEYCHSYISVVPWGGLYISFNSVLHIAPIIGGGGIIKD